ncbi:MAG: hypothetical protein HKP59_11975 [Lutibacter sp.]|uniref:hypothetical protein n=1 Tax=Lutibacter sp. TaxID=1925666 RepID=UPI0017F513FD|nr:hypothetical protein [Lutibacter sp.]MBT8318331.1 hypothetical protein [Lutibacter sp.]NNJ59189.1 hypothetical protein [Lutibacter sp.]
MRINVFLCLFLISSTLFGQEIGSAKNGSHSIKLLKSDNLFSFVYSDINCETQTTQNSFYFKNKETVYALIMDGFKNVNNHQMIIQANNDTIVKFEFSNIKGQKMVKIRQNNLPSNTFGSSTFFSKEEIHQLFGNP